MTLLHLPAATRVAKPWKNGGGETTDVMVRPDGASLDDFVARVSIARVASAGPFSVFPGIDRTIAILSGDGLDLAVGEAPALRLTPASGPHRFPADVATAAALLGDAVTDLNVMTRRGAAGHHMRRLDLAPDTTTALDLADALVLWVDGEGTVATPEGSVAPAALDAVACATPGRWRVTATTAVRVFVVEFRRG